MKSFSMMFPAKSSYCHFTKPVFEVYVIISRSSQLACNHNSAGLFGYKKRAELIQATTGLVDTVLVETTVLVEEKTLTTQFYLLIVESPLQCNFFGNF